MRTFALLTFFTVGVLSQWSINYDKDLSCGSCVLGQYSFCADKPNNVCCKPTDTDCTKNGTLTCSSTKDIFTSLYKECNAANRPAACGPEKTYMINQANDTETFLIDKMGLKDSCTFKVFAKCSWPEFVVDSDQVVLSFASFKGKPDDKIQDDKADKLTWVPAGKNAVARPPAAQQVKDCNGQIRMYVTVSRVQPKNATQSFFAEEARVLQTAPEVSLNITIRAAKSAFLLKAGMIALFSVLALFAF
jgi:hypothetical protein